MGGPEENFKIQGPKMREKPYSGSVYCCCCYFVVVVVVAVAAYFILIRLLYLVFFSYLRPTMHATSTHGTPSLTSLAKDGGVSCVGR